MSATLQEPRTTPTATTSNPFWTEQAVLLAQAGVYILTGLWAILDIDSFQAVTGPKTDLWLVRTVGLLVTVIGGVLLLAARNSRAPLEVMVLAVGAAVGLALVDVIIVFTRTASPIYLLDAALELGLAAWWIALRLPTAPRVVQGPGPGYR